MHAKRRVSIFTVFMLSFSLLIGNSHVLAEKNQGEPEKQTPKEQLAEQNVMATAWFQTSGEAKALYHQAYNIGKEKLDAALEEGTDQDPAVVLDLDETVLDGSPFDALAIKTGGEASLDEWQESAEAEALPGALDFLHHADQQGVTIYYITGRSDKLQEATVKNLKKIGAPQADDDHVLLKQEGETGKQDRFDDVDKNHDILLFFGDNLSDFSGFPKNQPLDARNKQVNDEKDTFGDQFIVFPNPMYGDWESALYPDGDLTAEEKMQARKDHLTYFSPNDDSSDDATPDDKKLQDQNMTSIAWYQTAGEAEALYHQAYNIGKEKLDTNLEEGTNQNPAIVLDVDETVLDGGPYNATMTKTGGQASLDEWQESAKAEAVPGALEFLNYADDRGVEIYYVTGRSDRLQDATVENLEKIGAPQVDNDHVLLTKEGETGKQDRFDKIDENHDILLFFGDNLSDFTGFPKDQELAARNQQVDEEQDAFGDSFIVFPNPMYGDWESALYDGDLTAEEKMQARKDHLDYFQNKSKSAEAIKDLVSQLHTEGEIADKEAHALQMHLTAVSHYENNSNAEKVIKHLEGFKKLLDYQNDNDLITKNAYDTLLSNADALIQKWKQSLEDFELSILHMNDTHAHTELLPQMVTAIKEEREEKPDSLLFHAGDAFSGTLYFTEFGGQADMALFNLMDMTAMTYGNHEFDRGDKEDGNETLAEFVDAAEFPFLGSNIDFSDDPFMNKLATDQSLVRNADPGKSYYSMIEEVNGEEIGIFSLDTEETTEISRPNQVVFHNYLDTAEEAVAEFEEEGVDKIIALSHLGYDSDPVFGNDQLLAEIDGIDVIVGGHTHTALKEPVVVTEDADGHEKDPTVIVQAGEYSQYLGTLDMEFDDDGVVTGHSGELLDVDDYDADPEAVEVLKPYAEKIKETENEAIGAEALKDIKNSGTGVEETPIGNLVTDAMLAGAKSKFDDTVIAFQNGGGIRATIEKGPITTGDVINVLPFGNNPVVGKLTGAELKEVLEHSVHLAPEYHGGFLHVSGMTFKFDSNREPGNRVVEMKVNKNGEYVDIDPDEAYLVTTNEFTAQGGDGFETLAKADEEGRFKDIGENDWEQIRDYMVNDLNGKVDPEIEGRIIDIAKN
ncbi:5'-nucleotidase, lipoprotein e(P4) family [Lentibacillus sp. L22]|uniref:5'-nucleotidase, lipoprotein e(P4) family n=1 Tax=Lentibacillus sp. L22 TaxID=3163028 RepID=UPI0034651BA1